MSRAQDNGNETRNPARLAAAVLFVLVVGMGYAVSPHVEGAVDLPNAVEDQDTAEQPYLTSGCAIDGLVFSECFLDF
jgi:hypothetical protein